MSVSTVQAARVAPALASPSVSGSSVSASAASASVPSTSTASAGAASTPASPPVPPSAAVPSVAVPSAAVPSAAVPSPAVPSAAVPSPAVPSPGTPGQSRDLLAGSARELLAAGSADDPETRYAHAHLAALRAAAAVLAARAQPRGRRSSRVRSAWVLLAEVAPELAEWAAFFAAGAGKRAAAEAGLRGVVSEREADDLLRDVETFLALVARILGVTRQLPLPVVASRAS
jgi:hypothetical protein